MIKVSDYIADFFVRKNIHTIFTVVGGGAMHLNNSFGHNSNIHCVYNHHEQAAAIAAEAYFRVNRQLAAVCVTSGPGAVNALTGVVGAYQDSIPMIVVSGQVKSTLMVKNSGLKLRTLGGQEFDIVSSLSNATKYAETVTDRENIRFCLEKAYYTALSGRPGPCWLDLPLDIQSSMVNPEELKGFIPNEEVYDDAEKAVEVVLAKISDAKRPVLYAGNGIRIAGAATLFKNVVKKLRIPIVTCWDSIDLIESDNMFYSGRAGIMGDRAGNFAVQNCDFLLCIGNRLSVYQVGYDVSTWARKAYVVDVDIDAQELKKKTMRVDIPIHLDAYKFLYSLLGKLDEVSSLPDYSKWQSQCMKWRKKYPVVTEKHYGGIGNVNVYAFIDQLSSQLPKNSITVVANGSASVVGSQTYRISDGQRFIMNCALSSMGYDLPAAIGVCEANDQKTIICIAGDGSIQMNIQELQTIITNKLPIKIFVINNGGYHQIRLTQNNLFQNGLVGVGPESGDLGFPDFEKLAWAYGFPYIRIERNDELTSKLKKVLKADGYYICEVVCSTDQAFEPKSATKKLENGILVSPPLEDMAPFLSRDELKENMLIDMIGDEQ